MPTTRPRHLVTETDDVARALDAAGHRWPTLRRPQLLVKLALEAAAAAEAAADGQTILTRRQEVVERSAGALTGAYHADYLPRLREDWPQ